MTIDFFSFTLSSFYIRFACKFGSPDLFFFILFFLKTFVLFLFFLIQNISTFTLEKLEDGREKMETGKGKCPFEPSQHYTAVMAGMKHTHALDGT